MGGARDDDVATHAARARREARAIERRATGLERRAEALRARRKALGTEAREEDVAAARCAAEAEREEARIRARGRGETVESLREKRDAVMRTLEEARRHEAERLAPMVVSAREECEMLREEIEGCGKRAEALTGSRDERERRACEVERACASVREALEIERERLKCEKAVLGKIRAEKDALFETLTRARADAATLETRAETLRCAETDAETSVRRNEQELSEHVSKNAKFDEQLSTAERGLNDLKALLERESLARDEIAAEGVRRELDRRACQKSLTRAKQTSLRETRANAHLTYLVNEMLTNARSIADIVEDVEGTKAALERELATAVRDTKRTIEEQNALRLDVNERREECKVEITKGDLLAHTVTVTVRQEIADLEDEVKCLRREEAARNRIQKYVADRVSRAMKRHQGVQQNIAQLKSLLRIRDAEMMDVKSNIDDARERRSHFERLRELTTTQRDAFATIVRKSGVIAGATREKNECLHLKTFELERQAQEKDWEVSAARGETDAKKRERDARRNQNDAVSHVILRARADMEVSETELGKLQNELKAGKCDQELLFEQSKALVKSRQAVAMELLDRNDELCQLCDRIATSEDVSRQCEEELALRVHECETLRRQVHDLERSLIVARRNVAAIPRYQAEISSKRSTLYEMRVSAENLSQRLEDPNEHTRWRLIHGPKGEQENDVDVDVFNDKLASVGSRIQDQERELARRRLRCQDIDREIERLRAVIAENADEAIETASSLNRAKSKLSAVERALLAAVSELTMYRALTAALADAKSRNIAEVDALRLSLET